MRQWARITAAVLAACVLAAGPAQAQQGASASGGAAQALSGETSLMQRGAQQSITPEQARAELERRRQLHRWAEQGDAFVQSSLGNMYYLGRGVPQNYAEAARWFRLAAEQGNAFAQSQLGSMYADGVGVPQNYQEAIYWHRLAAEQGDATAQVGLGAMYANGLGGPQNYAEAARWFRLAAEQGAAPAQYLLGIVYASGSGVPQDYVEAYKWCNLAAAAGDENAREARDRIARRMTPAQIAEGQRRAAAWRPTTAPQQ